MKKPNKRFIAVLDLLLWTAFIYFLSSRPGLTSGTDLDFLLRKIAHVGEYLVLTLLMARALYHNIQQLQVRFFRLYAYSGLFALLYAISDEIHQSYVPNRNGSPVDVAIDAIGIALALLLAHFVPKTKLFAKWQQITTPKTEQNHGQNGWPQVNGGGNNGSKLQNKKDDSGS